MQIEKLKICNFGMVIRGFLFFKRWAGILQFEPVPDPGLRQQKFRVGGILFDLFSQLIDEHPKVFDFFSVVGSPHGLEEFHVRHGNIRMGHQVPQEFEFLWRQPNGLPV